MLRRAPSGVRQLVSDWIRSGARRQPRGGAPGPVLSVVVPVYNVERYLPACLDSVLAQDMTDLEIIVVDDGSTDGSSGIIADYAARDPRIRTLRQKNAGQGPARNRGVTHARGEFLVFLDADDMVPPDAYGHMVSSLRKSGSDFSVGAVRRLDGGEYHRPSWNAVVHEHDRIGITIDDFPAALGDVIACNRMFRRAFWVNTVGGFPGGVLYEDHVPMVAAYLRATRFDLLARITYDWRIRDDLTSTGQQKHELHNLTDRIKVKAQALELVQAEASESVRAAWIGRVLDTDLTPYIDHALHGGEEYRATLRDAFATYLKLATPDALAHARVQQKVRSHLAAKGAWDQLEIAQRFFRDSTSIPPTMITEGRILLDDSLLDLLNVELPSEVRELSINESRLQACALHAEWIGPASLRVTGWAVIRGLDFEGRSPELELSIVRADSSERIDLDLEHVRLSEATAWVGWPHGSFDNAGFRSVIDFSDLAARLDATQDWRLRIQLTVDGTTREGGMHHAVAGSSASSAAITSQRVSDDGVVAVPQFDTAHGLIFTLRRPAVIADRLEPAFVDRLARGRIRCHGAKSLTLMAVRAIDRTSGREVDGIASSQPDGSYEFSVHLPPFIGPDGIRSGVDWDLRMVDDRGRTRRVGWPSGRDETSIVADVGERLYWLRSPRGYVQMVADRPYIHVNGVDVEAGEIRVQVECDHPSAAILASASLFDGQVQVPLESSLRHDDGRVVLVFPIAISRPGLAPRPLAAGSYALEVVDDGGAVHEVPLAPLFAATLPVEIATDTHQARVRVAGQRALRIVLSAPA